MSFVALAALNFVSAYRFTGSAYDASKSAGATWIILTLVVRGISIIF